LPGSRSVKVRGAVTALEVVGVEEAGEVGVVAAEGDCMSSRRKKACVGLRQQMFVGHVANLAMGPRSAS
jgi:hypothetical protein